MGLLIAFAVVAVAALLGIYLSWTAGRLDRLHNRTEAARASLDSQLVRRAALAGEIAHAATDRGALAAADGDRLAASAQRALESPVDDRGALENALGHTMRDVLTDTAVESMARDDRLRPMLRALDVAMTKVVLARRFHATAVEDTMVLRRGRPVRWFRLAGSAPMPTHFDIDDTPVPLVSSPVVRPR